MANLKIEIVYARPDDQRLLSLEVSDGTTIETAIERSGILEMFPEIDLTQQKIGVFGKIRSLSDVLKAGDRIEIYRPLTIDPKDARRKRAKDAGQFIGKKWRK
jgi:hypothetical protein